MKYIGTAFLRGLATVLPIGLTLYFVYFLAVTAEAFVSDALDPLLAPINFPGLGILIGLLAITLVGLIITLPGLNVVFRLGDAMVSRIPFVKSVYTTLRDLIEMVTGSDKSGDRGQPVIVNISDGIQLIGLVTEKDSTLGDPSNPTSLVYLPMSYQVGGYTVSIEKDRLTPLDMTVEEAMTFVVTAGVRRQ